LATKNVNYYTLDIMGLLSRLFGREAEQPSKPRHGDGDMVSLVVLSASCPELALESVRSTLDELFPGEFLPPREEGNFVIDGSVPQAQFMVQCVVPNNGGVFMVQNVPSPYTEFSNFLSHISDPTLHQLAAAQSCWLSVDLMHQYEPKVEDAYRFIGALLAKLAPSDAAVLVHPSRMDAVRFTEHTRRQLAAGDHPFGMV